MINTLIRALGGYTGEDVKEAHQRGQEKGASACLNDARHKAEDIEDRVDDLIDDFKSERGEHGYIVISNDDEQRLSEQMFDIRETAAHIKNQLDADIEKVREAMEAMDD
jgi:hypothetical protein